MQGFGQNLASGGLDVQVFGHDAPENGAEGAVLENFSDFECGKRGNWLKLLRTAIKRKNRGTYDVFRRRRRRKIIAMH